MSEVEIPGDEEYVPPMTLEEVLEELAIAQARRERRNDEESE